MSAYAKYAVQPTVKRLSAWRRRSIETPQVRASKLAQTILRPRAGLRIDPHLHLSLPVAEDETQNGSLRRPGDRGLAAVDAQLEL